MEGHNGHSNQHEDRFMIRIIKGVIIALIVILAVLIVFFILQTVRIHRAHDISSRELFLEDLFERHGAPTVADVGVIRSWMTFDYIDKLFGIPPDYLQGKLMVTDTRYPRVTIGGYANGKNIDTNTLVSSTQEAVKEYLLETGTSTPTSTQSI